MGPRIIAAGAATGLVASVLMTGALPGAAQDTAPITALEGAGASVIGAEVVPWQNAMAGAEFPVQFNYYARGSTDGRAALLRGEIDFAVSGTPFSEAELATLPAGESILTMPISVTSLTVLATTPANVGWRTESLVPGCDPEDPDNPNPEACYRRGVFTGPFRLPPNTLAALILGLSTTFEDNQLATWRHPDVATAMGTSTLAIQARRNLHHTFVNRTEGSSSNHYLQVYAQTLGTRAWQLRLRENPEHAWEPVGETFSPRTLTRYGLETAIGIAAIAVNDVATGSTPDTWSGNMVAIPTTMVRQTLTDYPRAGFVSFEIQNRLGEWVSPTPEAVTAALNAEPAGSAMTATLTDVPGGYPIVWVNRLAVRPSTLDPAGAAGIAALVRYAATDGQDAIVTAGGTALTPALRQEALAAADRLVTITCPQQGWALVSGPPGVFEPNTPALSALPAVVHCLPVPGSAPAAVAAAPAATGSYGSSYGSSYSSSYSSYAPTFPDDALPADATGEGTGAEAAGEEPDEPEAETEETGETVEPIAESAAAAPEVPRGTPLDAMPLDVPAPAERRVNTLSTMVLGVAVFLGGRRLRPGRGGDA